MAARGLLACALLGAASAVQDSAVVYYSNDDGKITSSPADDGSQVATVFPGDGKISYVAFSGDDLYFTDRVYNTLSKLAVQGDASKNASASVVFGGFGEPHDFVVEGSHVYVADKGKGNVMRGDLSNATNGVTAVVTGLDGPVGVAVDGNYLYVSENTGGDVKRFKLELLPAAAADGETLVDGLTGPRSLLVAETGENLYYVEAAGTGVSAVRSLDLDTFASTDVLTALDSPNSIAAADEMIYVTDDADGAVYRAALTGVSHPKKDLEVFVKAAAPRAIAILAAPALATTASADPSTDPDDASSDANGAPMLASLDGGVAGLSGGAAAAGLLVVAAAFVAVAAGRKAAAPGTYAAIPADESL